MGVGRMRLGVVGVTLLSVVHDGAATPDGGGHADERGPVAEAVFDSDRGLGTGWMDFGYAPHQLARGAPITIDLSGYGGLILARPGLSGEFGGLEFVFRAPESFGDFLEVQLQLAGGRALARVAVAEGRLSRREDGSSEVWIPISKLDPRGERFERIMFFARRPVGHDPVVLDRIALTRAPSAPPEPARSGRVVLDCAAPGSPISPLIYGVGGADGAPWFTEATARRWGGNPTSRYNWELNTWNLAADWFFRNRGNPRSSYDAFLEENLRRGVKTALTVPMLGWVAKDATSYSFPVSVFGAQKATASDEPDAGNGLRPDGTPISPGPPARTSTRSTPDSIERWVRAIREKDRARGRSVHLYLLDNEPMLWSTTHRDVHPEPATYDELLQRTIAYASAVRRADPEATIGGPAAWGWMEYHYSAVDAAAGVHLRPDRRSHGDVALIPWYLRSIAEHERRTKTRLLDVLDVHFYSMAQGVGVGTGGDTDPATAARRIRSTRSLWDPTYVDESWIGERMRVLPLLRKWVEENHPGLGIALGEWNFGAETHMSGGLAAAEVLGRFGTEGLHSAFYWTFPPEGSPAAYAFRAYRNFDGRGGRFLDWTVPTTSSASLASAFASRDADRRHLVVVLLNFAPRTPIAAALQLQRCGPLASARAFAYAGGEKGFVPLEVAARSGAVDAMVPPYSITVLDLALGASP